jgi:hypothetical protein
MHFVVENAMAATLDRNLAGSRPSPRHKRQYSGSSVNLFEVEDSLKKPLYGILMKAPFFNDKKYEKVCYEVSEVTEYPVLICCIVNSW